MKRTTILVSAGLASGFLCGLEEDVQWAARSSQGVAHKTQRQVDHHILGLLWRVVGHPFGRCLVVGVEVEGRRERKGMAARLHILRAIHIQCLQAEVLDPEPRLYFAYGCLFARCLCGGSTT